MKKILYLIAAVLLSCVSCNNNHEFTNIDENGDTIISFIVDSPAYSAEQLDSLEKLGLLNDSI